MKPRQSDQPTTPSTGADAARRLRALCVSAASKLKRRVGQQQQQRRFAAVCGSALFFIAAVGLPAQGAQPSAIRYPPSAIQPEVVLTNASVVKLVRARFSDKTIIAIIRTRPANFDLAPDRLIELKKSGVSERVILEMIARDGAAMAAAGDDDAVSDAFDDPFFGSTKNPAGSTSGTNRNGGGGGGNEVDIFGSTTGGRNQTRTQGGNGSSEGEQQTTGSATVRILRPPAEAGGGAPPKLERTPTLTNQSIVELIDAGFSEGTIIRRIEGSPADYDLSPAKLAELRRRRVSEPVINAMRAAMGEDVNHAKPGASTETPEK